MFFLCLAQRTDACFRSAAEVNLVAGMEGKEEEASVGCTERVCTLLTLTLKDDEEAEMGGELDAGEREGVRKVTGGLEVDMKRRRQGTFFYEFGGSGKVGVAWRLVREGETEREASLFSRSQSLPPVTAKPLQSGAALRLQLQYRTLRKEGPGNDDEEIPCPLPGSFEEKEMVAKRRLSAVR